MAFTLSSVGRNKPTICLGCYERIAPGQSVELIQKKEERVIACARCASQAVKNGSAKKILNPSVETIRQVLAQMDQEEALV